VAPTLQIRLLGPSQVTASGLLIAMGNADFGVTPFGEKLRTLGGRAETRKQRALRYLLYFGAFGFRSDEDGDFRVGVFPEGEESVVLGAGFIGFARKRQGTRELGVG
jgi:hypothetical protein